MPQTQGAIDDSSTSLRTAATCAAWSDFPPSPRTASSTSESPCHCEHHHDLRKRKRPGVDLLRPGGLDRYAPVCPTSPPAASPRPPLHPSLISIMSRRIFSPLLARRAAWLASHLAPGSSLLDHRARSSRAPSSLWLIVTPHLHHELQRSIHIVHPLVIRHLPRQAAQTNMSLPLWNRTPRRVPK